ncbi:MAG: sulfite exporter TauE/SafE family protein [Candidatus Nanopelagicales bacterium]|nr:sulfite exporter TauE/SafE family protein [Candidatus Nanopelagicales bacterium]
MNLGDIDLALALGGLVAGLMVGLTGMGGAALVTPMLVLLFGIPPAAAVSSDVFAAAVMKPVGAAVHMRNKTVHWGLVGWLSLGSIPGVLIGTLIFANVLATSGADETIRTWIGVVLIIALCAMLLKTYLTARSGKLHCEQELLGTAMPVQIVPTVALGLVIGLIVGMTSVGSGSLMVTVLLLIYPLLRPSVLVGTDLTQAVPMLIAGAIAHAGLGNIDIAVVVSLLIGQLPGVYFGARLSARYDGRRLRYLLMVVLAATAIKLLGAPSVVAGTIAIVGVLVIGTMMLRERVRSTSSCEPLSSPSPEALNASCGKK